MNRCGSRVQTARVGRDQGLAGARGTSGFSLGHNTTTLRKACAVSLTCCSLLEGADLQQHTSSLGRLPGHAQYPTPRIHSHSPLRPFLPLPHWQTHQGSIYGYELAEGTLTHKFPDLHKGVHINCMVYLPDQQMMLTSTSDSGGTVGVGAQV